MSKQLNKSHFHAKECVSYLQTMNQKLMKTTPKQEANVCGPTGLAVGRDGPNFFAGRAWVIANVINVVMKPKLGY